MTFTIIDKTTGKEPTDKVITEIAKTAKLMEMDIALCLSKRKVR